jgi:hypothetical protein
MNQIVCFPRHRPNGNAKYRLLVSNTETRLSHKRKKTKKGVQILSGNIAIAGNKEMRLKSVGESNSAIPG